MNSSQITQLALNPNNGKFLGQLLRNSGYDDYFILATLALSSVGYLGRGILWDKPDPYHYKWFERPQATAYDQINSAKETRDIAQKLEESGRDFVIFWGSQSGTAEGFAHRLAADCRQRFRLNALVADLTDYEPTTIHGIVDTKFAIFIVSTYGEGDPSDNTASFHRWIISEDIGRLNNLRYAAFGLGNSNYKYYNKIVDVVADGLQEAGAQSILPVGRADDAKGMTQESFLEWKQSLFTVFREQWNMIEYEATYEPTLKVVEDDSIESIGLYLGDPQPPARKRSALSISPAVVALPVNDARALTSVDVPDRKCLHLELDLGQHSQVKYKTGDHLAIWPVNPDEEVARLLRVLGLNASKDIPISILSTDPDNHPVKVPTPTTARALFQHYLEICAPVSRETVQALAQFAPSPPVKSGISSFAAADKKIFATQHYTIGRVLEHTLSADPTAKWDKIPITFLIESLRPMTPRYYSISSSSIVSPRQISITVAVNRNTSLSDPGTYIPGLATSYLSSFSIAATEAAPNYSSISMVSPTIHAHVRRSAFKLPASPTVPLVLVAAGTGIAPFRAFLHERARIATMGKEVGPIVLFFGCRSPTQDYLYKEEIEGIQAGPLKGKLNIVTAFSRLPSSGSKKVYVQDRLVQHAGTISKLLADDEASLFICGSATMAREVGAKVVTMVGTYKRLEDDQLARHMASWARERKRSKKWQEDVWG